MAKKLYGQNSFMGGQIDHVLIGKADNALSAAKNVVSSLRGEMRPRTGIQHLMELSKNTVVVPFRAGESDKLCLFDNDGLKIYDYVDGELQEYLNGAPAEEFVQDWTANTTNGYSVFIHGLGLSEPAGDTNNSYKAFEGEGLSQFRYNWNLYKNDTWISFELPTDSTKKVNKFHVSFKSWQTISSVESIDRFNGFKNGILQYSDDGGNTWQPIKTLRLNYQEYDSRFAMAGGSHAGQRSWEIEYDLIAQDSTPHKLYRIYFLAESFVYSPQAPDSMYVRIKPYLQENTLTPLSADWALTDEQLGNIKYSQFENRLYLTTYPQTQPKLLQLDGDVFTFQDFLPRIPAENSFWETNGYPSCVRHFQGRLFFGGFNASPARVVGSRFLVEDDFEVVATQATAKDPIDATCNELKSQIKNIYGGNNALYVMSNDGVSMINASGVIAPTDINFRLRNVAPASNITPTVKNDIMLYVGADLTKVYTVEYDLITERYRTNNEAWKAQDFFIKQVKEIHYVEDKERFVYALMKDGTFAAILFEQPGAFYVFPCQTFGTVLDMCPIKQDDSYAMIFVTQRQNGYNLELKLPEHTPNHSFLLSNEQKQQLAISNIADVPYVDAVRHININNVALPNKVALQEYKNKMYISEPIGNDSIYSFSSQSGCEIHLTNLDTNQTLKATIGNNSINKLFYAWVNTGLDYAWTYAANPEPGDSIYSSTGDVLGTVISGGSGNITTTYADSTSTWARDPRIDYESRRTEIYLNPDSEITTQQAFYATLTAQTISIPTVFEDNTEFQVIGDNQYFDGLYAAGGQIMLPKPLWNLYYGLPYEKTGMLTVVGNLMSLKTWGTIAINLQDTLHLNVGADKNNIENLIEYRPTGSSYDTIPMIFNGVIQKNIADKDEYVKNLIFNSNKGLPFCVVNVLADGSVSDMGGN